MQGVASRHQLKLKLRFRNKESCCSPLFEKLYIFERISQRLFRPSRRRLPTMRFIMSTRLAWSANYCNQEGQVVFRTESPGPRAKGQDIKVLRVVPPCLDSNLEVASEADLRDFFETVGEVNYRVFTSSSIVYRGTCHPTDTFFTKGVLRSSLR